MRVKDFIKNQWSEYADYDNRRSLPNLIDGLKISQRKAMYTAMRMAKGAKPVRVSQFASEVSKETAYHHGEQSMIGTVVGLAQDYPGSNNVPLLEKHGQFGSRLSHEAAAPRYIFTKISSNWDTYFPKDDQDIVEYLFDDDEKIEPKYFIPTLPMVLLNGAEGVGNGFRSQIAAYTEKSIKAALMELIKNGTIKTKLVPYINGYTGTITREDKQLSIEGVLEITNTTKITITELPPSYDNDKYKILLNKLIEDDFIKDYHNKSTEDSWLWVIDCPRSTTSIDKKILMDKFGLVYRDTEVIVGWGVDDSMPLKFDTPEALLEYWYAERLKLYAAAIKHRIKIKGLDIIKADLRIRFIKWCIKNDFRKLTKAEFIDAVVKGVKGADHETASEMVNIAVYRITTDEVDKIERALDVLMDELDILRETTPEQLFRKSLI